MAFADPQSVTINAVANTLARVSSGNLSGSFQKDDGTVKLAISHEISKGGTRHFIRLDHSKIASDPFTTTANRQVGVGVWMVIATPKYGYTIAEQKQIVDALVAYLSASSGANVTKLLGDES